MKFKNYFRKQEQPPYEDKYSREANPVTEQKLDDVEWSEQKFC